MPAPPVVYRDNPLSPREFRRVPPPQPHPSPQDEPCLTLLDAYRAGVFPMPEPGGPVRWYDPDPRGIIPIEPGDPAGAPRVSRSLRQRVRSGRFGVTADTAFERVVRACAEARPGQTGLECWIDDRIVAAYTRLHELGHAHSVEAWAPADAGRALVGGLYGVAIGGLFAGESMFSRPELGGTDASKVCLVHLAAHLRRRGFVLLDTQFWTPHLGSLGAVEIARDAYRERLARAVELDAAWGEFNADASADLGILA